MNIEHALIHHIISNYYIALIPNIYYGVFECDVLSINKKLYTVEYEIKCSKKDFQNDFKKNDGKWINPNNKHDLIKNGQRTNRFFFVVEKGIEIDIPEYAGLISFERKNSWVSFRKIKNAPRLHGRQIDEKKIKRCLEKLSWKYYLAMHDRYCLD
uniref:Uncharacterized protein n=1 Tax=viral metagenome TaxID=1070528 RepID=A0A6M3LQR3_9ZZZZ